MNLTFDDVLIKPQWSRIKSRMDTDTSGYFSRNVRLNLPIASANMRTVTDTNMCFAMHNEGAIGILHRYFENLEAWANELLQFETSKLQTPVTYGISVGYKNWKNILELIYLGQLRNRVHKPVVVVYDVANAANDHIYFDVEDLLSWKKSLRDSDQFFDLVIGNIATASAASVYKELDIDGIKVGIGPSSVCSTRLITGCGVPQLTAIQEVCRVLKNSNIKLIADGGITKPADFCKALAAGADSIMMGTTLAYAKESPGWKKIDTQSNYAIYKYEKELRGEASFSSTRTKEGVSKMLKSHDEPKTVRDILSEYSGGLRSCMSYCNASNIAHLQENHEFITVSSNTLVENQIR